MLRKHSGSGKRGAFPDRKRWLPNCFDASQLMRPGRMLTA
jgi:hypothetical protein